MKNKLDHLLACLGEECGEVQQVVGKSLRFGIYDRKPSVPTDTNFELIRKEVHDIVAVYHMLCAELGEDDEFSVPMLQAKYDRVKHYMNYSRQKSELA